MCEDCGCAHPSGSARIEGRTFERAHDGTETVTVLESLLAANDRQAAHNRTHFNRHQVLAVNLMSSPGAGKTALLERTIDAIGDRVRVAVIEGDLATDNDAVRIRARGVPAVQITTGSACHLDAHMVHAALHELPLVDLDLVFIENVGNLVCPASFDLGQHRNVTLISVTEGEDKPAKYPVMFRAADLVLVSKADLLAFIDDFSATQVERHLRALGSGAAVHTVASKPPIAIGAWLEWLEHELRSLRVSRGEILQRESRALHATARRGAV